MKRENFKKTIDGKDVDLFVLKNDNGVCVSITNYGAKVVSICVPDKNGEMIDVVLGHSSIDEYLKSEEPYFGAICGRTGNRIAKGKFSIDGKEYTLAVNNGPNNLHGGIKGFNSVVWDLKHAGDQSVEFHYLSEDGEEGFPGNLSTVVTYTLTKDNALDIVYSATTDKATIINLTNHSYFNLSGAGVPSIEDHLLCIFAETYLPTDDTAIPLGSPACVEGTPMDFKIPHAVGERINEPFEQLIFAKGYDHTYVLDKKEDEFRICAILESPQTGIVMEVLTTEPGVQLYTGNWMSGNFTAKDGKTYPMRSALCLETQHFPNSINTPEYPTTELWPGQVFESRTQYKFSVSNNH